jgi:hypothetical protein
MRRIDEVGQDPRRIIDPRRVGRRGFRDRAERLHGLPHQTRRAGCLMHREDRLAERARAVAHHEGGAGRRRADDGKAFADPREALAEALAVEEDAQRVGAQEIVTAGGVEEAVGEDGRVDEPVGDDAVLTRCAAGDGAGRGDADLAWEDAARVDHVDAVFHEPREVRHAIGGGAVAPQPVEADEECRALGHALACSRGWVKADRAAAGSLTRKPAAPSAARRRRVPGSKSPTSRAVW